MSYPTVYLQCLRNVIVPVRLSARTHDEGEREEEIAHEHLNDDNRLTLSFRPMLSRPD